MKKLIVVSIVIMSTLRCFAAGGQGMVGFLRALAGSDVVGIGVYGGTAGDWEYRTQINDITYWLGDPGTNSVLLAPIPGLDGPVFPQDEETNDVVVFFGTRLSWNPFISNAVFRSTPFSAWEWREKLTQTGSAGQLPPDNPFYFPGDWINVTTNSPATLNFISNVVHTLCVEPDLIEYSQALIPPLNVDWNNELFMFKADVHMEMLKLEWGEDEAFLVHVLNSPQYPRRFRGSALFQLQKRFGWSETNTVPGL